MLFILAGFLVQPISIVPNKKPQNRFHKSKYTQILRLKWKILKLKKKKKKRKRKKKGPLWKEQLRGCVPKTPLSFSLFLCFSPLPVAKTGKTPLSFSLFLWFSPPPVAKTGKRASSPQNKFILCLVAEKRRKISMMMRDGPLLELLYKIF